MLNFYLNEDMNWQTKSKKKYNKSYLFNYYYFFILNFFWEVVVNLSLGGDSAFGLV